MGRYVIEIDGEKPMEHMDANAMPSISGLFQGRFRANRAIG